MVAQDILKKMISNRFQRNFVIPHYTPPKWWECDIFEITKSGFFVEYEIKVSRSDFFADTKKRRQIFDKEKREYRSFTERDKEGNLIGKCVQIAGPPILYESKHDLLSGKNPDGPTRFWYATPQGLLKPEEIPAWAGLVEVGELGWETRIKHAPRLHKEKYQHRAQAEKICYWRMHTLLQRVVAVPKEL